MTTWRLWVDWDGDGVYEADEGGRLFGLNLRRGRRYVLREDGKGFQPPEIGGGSLLLIDLDGRYDPWNAASPLYPNFTASKRFRLEVEDGAVVYPIAMGRIRRIQRQERVGMAEVRLDIEDGWALLDEEVNVAMQRDITTGQAMHLVLDAAGWPAGLRDIAPGSDTKEAWWASEKARLALHALAEAEYGALYMRGDGTVHFRSRHDDYTVAATVTAADIQWGVRIPLPWETVRTVARVWAYIPSEVSGALLTYRSPTQILGSSNEEIFIDARDVYIDSITGVTVTASANRDGSGADMSGDVSVVATVLSPQRVKLDIHNQATQPVWVQRIELSGVGVEMGRVSREARNASGVALYGERTLEMDNRWLQDVYIAKDFADHYAVWYGEPNPERAEVQVRLRDRTALQYGVDVGDVVHLDLGSVQGDYRVHSVEHRWLDRAGRAVETTWTLHPAWRFSDVYWVFTTRIGETSRFGF